MVQSGSGRGALRGGVAFVAITLLLFAGTIAEAAPFTVLWWDSTPEYGGQAPNALRQAMSDHLTSVPGGVFSSTYVGSETLGTLATHLSSNAYDVIVFDATTAGSRFNAADIAAIQAHYAAGNKNILLDGNLYVRSINFNASSIFPGPNGATGKFTVNEVYQLATRGGGIMIGTDHNCCQTDANEALHAILAGASFSGNTEPSIDGVFFGTDLVVGLQPFIPNDLVGHWDSIPSQGIAPTGAFTDFLGDGVTLFSQVEVADFIGGPRHTFISTSWAPGASTCSVDNPELCPEEPGTGVPNPGTLLLLGTGLAGVAAIRRRR